MGGEISIESEGLGKGTTVRFGVKLGLPEKPSETDRQITPSPASVHLRTDFSGVKVLVTDDNGYVICNIWMVCLRLLRSPLCPHLRPFYLSHLARRVH